MKIKTTIQCCLFCELKNSTPFAESTYFFAVKDLFPVTPLHLLIIPKEHRENYFDLTKNEADEVYTFLTELKNKLLTHDNTITGYNIGMNCGAAAGQTIFHCHIHLIPRRNGDTPDPRGGVRGVIAEKQKY